MTTPHNQPWQRVALAQGPLAEHVFWLEFPGPTGPHWQCAPLGFELTPTQLSTFESSTAAVALDQACLAEAQPGASALECFLTCVQTVNDAAERWLAALDTHLDEVMAQTSAVLGNLETRGRDFGVSDVIDAQALLDQLEAALARCIDNQLRLSLAAHQAQGGQPCAQGPLAERMLVLIEDIEAVEQHAEFMHLRIRFLQSTNQMALSVKQNQIVKVFSVITAVFLPALLISTYYSMNLANMPILKWQYGEPMVIGLTALLALLPLIYVKQRGWLR